EPDLFIGSRVMVPSGEKTILNLTLAGVAAGKALPGEKSVSIFLGGGPPARAARKTEGTHKSAGGGAPVPWFIGVLRLSRRDTLSIRQIRKGSKHRWQHPVGWLVAIEESADVDDDLLAHLDAALDRGRAHVGEHHDLAGARELEQLGIDRRRV